MPLSREEINAAMQANWFAANWYGWQVPDGRTYL
jgi:hypothetical protein